MNFLHYAAKFEDLFRETQMSIRSGSLLNTNFPSSVASLKKLIEMMELSSQTQATGGSALKSKIQKFWMDVQALEAEHKKLEKMNIAANQAKERERLFGGVTNRRPEFQVDMEAELAYQESFQQARNGLEGLIDSQRDALSTLRSNRNSLKGIKKRALDAANTLGMGGTVLRLIEKRSEQDMILFFAGCAIVVIFLVLLLVFFK